MVVTNHEKLLRAMDWSDKHDLWNKMNSIRGFRPMLKKLADRFAPDELLHGTKTGRKPVKNTRKIKLPDRVVHLPVNIPAPVVANYNAPKELTLESFGFKLVK